MTTPPRTIAWLLAPHVDEYPPATVTAHAVRMTKWGATTASLCNYVRVPTNTAWITIRDTDTFRRRCRKCVRAAADANTITGAINPPHPPTVTEPPRPPREQRSPTPLPAVRFLAATPPAEIAADALTRCLEYLDAQHAVTNAVNLTTGTGTTPLRDLVLYALDVLTTPGDPT